MINKTLSFKHLVVSYFLFISYFNNNKPHLEESLGGLLVGDNEYLLVRERGKNAH